MRSQWKTWLKRHHHWLKKHRTADAADAPPASARRDTQPQHNAEHPEHLSQRKGEGASKEELKAHKEKGHQGKAKRRAAVEARIPKISSSHSSAHSSSTDEEDCMWVEEETQAPSNRRATGRQDRSKSGRQDRAKSDETSRVSTAEARRRREISREMRKALKPTSITTDNEQLLATAAVKVWLESVESWIVHAAPPYCPSTIMSLVAEDTTHHPLLYEALRTTMQHCAKTWEGHRVRLSDISLAMAREYDEFHPDSYLRKYQPLIQKAFRLVAKQLDAFEDLPTVVRRIEGLQQWRHGTSPSQREWQRIRRELIKLIKPVQHQVDTESSARKMVMNAILNKCLTHALRDHLTSDMSPDSELMCPTDLVKAFDIIAAHEQTIKAVDHLRKQYEAELSGSKPPKKGHANAMYANAVSGKQNARSAAGTTQPRTHRADFIPICFNCGHPRHRGEPCDADRDGPPDLQAAQKARERFLSRQPLGPTGQANPINGDSTVTPAQSDDSTNHNELLASIAELRAQMTNLAGQVNAFECEELATRFSRSG